MFMNCEQPKGYRTSNLPGDWWRNCKVQTSGGRGAPGQQEQISATSDAVAHEIGSRLILPAVDSSPFVSPVCLSVHTGLNANARRGPGSAAPRPRRARQVLPSCHNRNTLQYNSTDVASGRSSVRRVATYGGLAYGVHLSRPAQGGGQECCFDGGRAGGGDPKEASTPSLTPTFTLSYSYSTPPP
ncbi:hypothetical protein E2C01_081269 [Portunus trituberculatus]|uniref:Uncharacterized protein n=1 Tax=Portunus trituberculatus TaxID=210409 RepID=A0A5B7ILS5_PORTR|nr:hypothetical protein [Portunus trituberculatus]